jgi:exonuclease SbcD
MKLLHTSDWHLGRSLHGEPLLEHQRAFLTWLVGLAAERRVDAVLVAGDVYDRAVPSTDAVQALDDALVAFARRGIPVVLSSGNHDSAIRLGFGAELQQAAGIRVCTRVSDLERPLVLSDDGGEVAIYGIPYLLPDAVRDEFGTERSHAAVLGAAVARIRTDAQRRGIARVVALAHAYVTGAEPSDSERDIRVGGIADAPASVFDGLAYAALGHLHGAQRVGDAVRYSGSPLAFSFSERHHAKSVTLVDLAADGTVTTDIVATPVPRPLREVRGRLADLLVRDQPDLADAWLKVVLTDARRPMAPMERLRDRWPNTIVLDFQPEGVLTDAAADLRRLSEAVDPVEVCATFMEWVDSTRPDDAHADTLRSAIESVRRAELSA